MKRSGKRIVSDLKNENLDRFAGSSDEEDEEKAMAPPTPATAVIDSRSDSDEDSGGADDEYDGRLRSRDVGNDENDDLSSVEGEESDMASKMANVMSRILGSNPPKNTESDALLSSVVLAKTVTPLQKLQQKEKKELKAMKEKRQANRERNLTALHLPLSIATTNNVDADGQLSVAKELEQERFHRRVATRGVVALFNAITQHQKNSTTDNNCSSVLSKKKEISKLTKHGFLDKIKAAAKKKGSDDQKKSELSKHDKNQIDEEGTNRASWGALQDDYIHSLKKNWDEESSDEELATEGSEVEADTKGSKSRKKPRFSRMQ